MGLLIFLCPGARLTIIGFQIMQLCGNIPLGQIFQFGMMTSPNGNIFRVTAYSPTPLNSPHKGQWHEALMFSLICAWTNSWVNNRDAGDLRRNRAHYDVIAMGFGDFVNREQKH